MDPFFSAGDSSGDSEPLLLVHGLGMSWRAWSPVLDRLAEHRPVFAPTLPGHRGGPELAPDTVDVPALVDEVERMLDAHRVGAAHIAGNSLGGWIALELARRGRATRVTAFAPAGVWRGDGDLRRLRVAAKVVGGLMRNPLIDLYTRWPATRRLLLFGLMRHGDRVSRRQAQEIVRDIAGCSMLGALARTDHLRSPLQGFDPAAPDPCPVHLVWGDKDRTLPYRRYGLPLFDTFPGARRTVLEDTGHVPMFDVPDRVTELLLEPAVV